MDAFVAMKKYISSNLIEQKYINNLVLEDHDRMGLLEESFKEFEEKKKINEIIYYIGIILSKRNNKIVLEYCSDSRIFFKDFILI